MLARVRADDASFLDAVLDGVFTVPGDGCIDFSAGVLAILARRRCEAATRCLFLS